MFSPEENRALRDDLVRLHSILVQDGELIEAFEKDPYDSLGCLSNDALYEAASGCKIDVFRSVSEAPLGTRFLTLEYCLSTIEAAEGDPGADPQVVAAAANVIAIYNAGVIGNAVAYHDVLLGAELAAAAVAVKRVSTWGQYSTPITNKQYQQPLTSIELSAPYLESNLHTFFEENGVGESREKMLIQSAISKSSYECNGAEILSEYSYRGTNFRIAVVFNEKSNRMTVTDGALE